jgi:hypothetical protein
VVGEELGDRRGGSGHLEQASRAAATDAGDDVDLEDVGVPCDDDGDLTIEVLADSIREARPKGRSKPNAKRRRPLPPSLSSLARAILRLLSQRGPLGTDEIGESLGSGVGDLAMELLHLEVEGIVRFAAGGYELTGTYDVSRVASDA